MNPGGNYTAAHPAGLDGSDPHTAATRVLLFRLAAGEELVTRHLNQKGSGLRLAHRRGYIESRRIGRARGKRHWRDATGLAWRHDLTLAGRAVAESLLGGSASPPTIF